MNNNEEKIIEGEFEEILEKPVLLEYILIKDGKNIFLDHDEARNMISKGIYYTSGFERDGEEIIETFILDADRSNLLPLVKFLDTPVGGGGSRFDPMTLGILAVVGFVLYYFMFSSGDEVVVTPESSTGTTISQVGGLPLGETPVVTPIITPVVTPENTNNDSLLSSFESRIRGYETTNHSLNLQIDSLQHDKSILTNNLNFALADVTEAKNIAKDYLNEALSYKEQLKFQKSLNLEENQLFLSLGKKVFEICEKNQTPNCTDLIIDFYNNRIE